MRDGTLVLIVLASATYVLKAAAPVVLGGDRALPGWLTRVAAILPAPLLAALVLTSSVVDGQRFVADARLIGLAAAAIALWRKANFVVVILAAAAATAAARAIGL